MTVYLNYIDDAMEKALHNAYDGIKTVKNKNESIEEIIGIMVEFVIKLKDYILTNSHDKFMTKLASIKDGIFSKSEYRGMFNTITEKLDTVKYTTQHDLVVMTVLKYMYVSLYRNDLIKNINKVLLGKSKCRTINVAKFDENATDVRMFEVIKDHTTRVALERMVQQVSIGTNVTSINLMLKVFNIKPIVDNVLLFHTNTDNGDAQSIHKMLTDIKIGENTYDKTPQFLKNRHGVFINRHDILTNLKKLRYYVEDITSLDVMHLNALTDIAYNSYVNNESNMVLYEFKNNILYNQRLPNVGQRYISDTITCLRHGTSFQTSTCSLDKSINIIGIAFDVNVFDTDVKLINTTHIDLNKLKNIYIKFDNTDIPPKELLHNIFNKIFTYLVSGFGKHINNGQSLMVKQKLLDKLNFKFCFHPLSIEYQQLKMIIYNNYVTKDKSLVHTRKVFNLPVYDISVFKKPVKLTITPIKKSVVNVRKTRLGICQHLVDMLMMSNVSHEYKFKYFNKYVSTINGNAACKSCGERLSFMDDYDVSNTSALRSSYRIDLTEKYNVTPIMSAITRMINVTGMSVNANVVMDIYTMLSTGRDNEDINNTNIILVVIAILSAFTSIQTTFKKNKICNLSKYDDFKTSIYKNVKICTSLSGAMTNILEYPLLGYFIFYISCSAIDTKTWDIIGTDKFNFSDRVSLSRKVVHTLNNLLQSKTTTYAHEIIRRVHFSKMISTYTTYLSIIETRPLLPTFSNSNATYVKLFFKRNLIKRKFFPLTSTHAINELTVCKDGRFHQWYNAKCSICKENFNEILSNISSMTDNSDLRDKVKSLKNKDPIKFKIIKNTDVAIQPPSFKCKNTIASIDTFIKRTQTSLGIDYSVNGSNAIDTQYIIKHNHKHSRLSDIRTFKRNELKLDNNKILVNVDNVTHYYSTDTLSLHGFKIKNEYNIKVIPHQQIQVKYSIKEMLLTYGYSTIHTPSVLDLHSRFSALRELINIIYRNVQRMLPTSIYHYFNDNIFVPMVFDNEHDSVLFEDDDISLIPNESDYSDTSISNIERKVKPGLIDNEFIFDVKNKSIDKLIDILICKLLKFIEINGSAHRKIVNTILVIITKAFNTLHSKDDSEAHDIHKIRKLFYIGNIKADTHIEDDGEDESDEDEIADEEEGYDLHESNDDDDLNAELNLNN